MAVGTAVRCTRVVFSRPSRRWTSGLFRAKCMQKAFRRTGIDDGVGGGRVGWWWRVERALRTALIALHRSSMTVPRAWAGWWIKGAPRDNATARASFCPFSARPDPPPPWPRNFVISALGYTKRVLVCVHIGTHRFSVPLPDSPPHQTPQ